MESEVQRVGGGEISGDNVAICHLRDAVAQGRHWYIALLEAIGLWDRTEEIHAGRHYRYLIADEAFDWLLLAERLLEEVDHLVPEEEMADLLFCSKAPIQVSNDDFRQLVGEAKYSALLNFFYGITVEEALFLAVEQRVRKEHQVYTVDGDQPYEETYEQIYGVSKAELLRRFRRERGYRDRKSMGLDEMKEFTYWLFKYRVKNCDKERVASDTKRALEELARQQVLVQRRTRWRDASTPACGPPP